MKNIKLSLALVVGIFAVGPAFADAQVSGNPSTWQLANYLGGDVTVFNTGATCIYGQMQMPSSLTSSDDRNRFWSMILTAKVTGRNVTVRYETTSGLCRITNFYIE